MPQPCTVAAISPASQLPSTAAPVAAPEVLREVIRRYGTPTFAYDVALDFHQPNPGPLSLKYRTEERGSSVLQQEPARSERGCLNLVPSLRFHRPPSYH